MAEDLRIELLADHPEAVHVLSEWEYGEWGHLMPDVSRGELADAFVRRANRAQIPMTLLGYLGERLVGTASLVVHDMSIFRELSPWLAILYVVPECRGRGYGSGLVAAVMREGTALGCERIYLFTPDQMPFYERLGWHTREVVDYRGERVSIMECSANDA